MTKSDRLSHIIQAYLEGDLELNTAVAELRHVYVDHGWHFSLVEAECEPRYREHMRMLVERLEAEVVTAPRRQT